MIPKVELHCHLDGSVRLETLAELSNNSIDAVKSMAVANNKCLDLNDYLSKFSLPVSVMQTSANLERIAYELATDLKNENVIYAEIRFAPMKHITILDKYQVVESVLRGLSRVDLKTNLILCMMRGDDLNTNKEVVDVARHFLNKGVCAVDLAGAEAIYKTSEYKELFDYVKENKIPFTIHAGEADGPVSIRDAISFGATRIGHGIRSIEDPALVELLKEKNVLLEVCPTSNIQTNVVDNINNHPIRDLYKNVLVSVNTDNRTVSNTTLTKEYNLLKTVNFTEEDFIKMNIDAINKAFISEEEKGELIRKYNSLKEV